MKKKPFMKIAFWLILIMFLGQFLGWISIRYFFLSSKIEELSPILHDISQEISEGTFESGQKDFIIKSYDLYENEIELNIEGNENVVRFQESNLDSYLGEIIPDVLLGEVVARIGVIKGSPNTLIVIGTPLVKNNQIIGTVFLVKPASDYRAALKGFCLVFVLASVLGGTVILCIVGLYLEAYRQLELTRRDYIANISHELRTPLSSIKGLSEALCDNMVPQEDKPRYYHIINRESFRLERLISDMLELSRLQNSKVCVEKTYFAGVDMMREIIDIFSVIADDMDIKFSVSKQAKNLPMLFSNEDRIIQVLNILIDNAFKFSESGGCISIDAKLESKKVSLSVANSGAIIPKEELAFVFDRFNKVETDHYKTGSGLGLSIAREIISALGEEITVNSEKNMTIFSFTVQR